MSSYEELHVLTSTERVSLWDQTKPKHKQTGVEAIRSIHGDKV
ncbi:hypothetical protein DSL72_009278 [Monilinia vaccinii-corymbosi]|uniref:Uncharacterized protein n=1 Tax=Monilinia vaccinii-corymbosi TaxID=61207 RepID=A0A8A3PQM7_9HELO|nr:hypothetical protein DSL72_009278 [Monilinia vaccinii-corymbosi]